MNKPLSKKELNFVIIFSLITVLITLMPVFYGYYNTPEGYKFMGLVASVGDANAYLDYMSQTTNRHFFFRNSYTSEDTRHLLIRPLFWVMGFFSIFLPSIFVWHLFRVMLGVVFLILAYHFISNFIKDVFSRRIAFLFIAVGSGFGYFATIINKLLGTNYGSTDLWVTESIPFLSLNGAPHFIFSYILIIGIMYYFYSGITKNKTKFIVYSALLAFILGFEHIYDMITVYLVVGTFILVLFFKEGKINYNYIKKSMLFCLISVPSFLYYASIFLFDPLYNEWTKQNVLLSPNLSNYVLGFGLVLLLALFYVFVIVMEKKYKNDTGLMFLSAWLVVNFLILYLPVSIQRRFVEGIFLPMAILAALGFLRIITILKFKNKLRIFAAILIVVLVLPSNAYRLSQLLELKYNPANIYSMPYFLENEEYEALLWLKRNTNPDDVILSEQTLSNYVPRVSGNIVYFGHWAQTINYKDKLEWFSKIDTSTIDNKELSKLGINFIMIRKTNINLKEVFHFENIRIYKIE